MLLPDHEIMARCRTQGIIEPYVRESVKNLNQVGGSDQKVISYGPSSYGYDVRVAHEFKIFTNVMNARVDPKEMDPNNFVDIKSESPVTIPPNSFALGRSLEWIKVPRDCLVVCIGKSTYARCGIVVNVTPLEPEWEGNIYARCGIVVNVTPLEPEWEGNITIEISNTTPNPALIYPNEGICQLLFHRNNSLCTVSYKDKGGKYQGQSGVTLPKA